MAEEIYCHAVNLFFEARGESPLGQRWVLDVVINRVESKSWDNTICGVVTAPAQFSWYTKHKEDMPKSPMLWEDYIYNLYKDNETELAAWQRCYLLALKHYLTSDSDLSEGSNHYMTTYVYNTGGQVPFYNTEVVEVIGNHIFFKSL